MDKTCTRCNKLKNLHEFKKTRRDVTGYSSYCLECHARSERERRKSNPIKIRELQNRCHKRLREKYKEKYDAHQKRYREKNRDKINKSNRLYAINNKSKVKEMNRRWQMKNPEKCRAAAKRWREKNPHKYREILKQSRKKLHPAIKASQNLGRLIRRSLHGENKGTSWQLIVGYGIKDLKNHLEKQFLLGMTWENYGKWHIDHKIPIAAFNFQSPQDIDFKRCWALSNLRPMWAVENQKKYAKLDKPFQPALAISI